MGCITTKCYSKEHVHKIHEHIKVSTFHHFNILQRFSNAQHLSISFSKHVKIAEKKESFKNLK